MSEPGVLNDLWQLNLRRPEDRLVNAISAIQDRCKFYNYEIWQESIQRKKNETAIGKGETHQTHHNFYGPVYGVAGYVEGNQMISPSPPSSPQPPVNPDE